MFRDTINRDSLCYPTPSFYIYNPLLNSYFNWLLKEGFKQKMKEFKFSKDNLIVLDFDSTIYHNPSQNFTININLNKVLPARYFFCELAYQVPLFSAYNFAHETQFLLLTGRPVEQREIILKILSMKGYKIDMASFSYYRYSVPEINMIYNENDFLIEYWTQKAEYINNLHRSNKYKSITAIDDDEAICTILKKLDFTVIQAQIQRIGIDLHIKFHPFNQRSNLQLLKKEVMIYG